MSATPTLAPILAQMSKIVAQPDTICTTDKGVEKLAARANALSVKPAFYMLGGPKLFAGMEIRSYPVGTTLTERRTGKVHTIREGWFFTCFFDDVTIKEPVHD